MEWKEILDLTTWGMSIYSVWYTYNESKRSNTSQVQVLECKATGSTKAFRQPTHIWELRVIVKNRGIPLHDPALVLSFTERDGFGRVYLPLKRRDETTGQHSEFARGMVAEFAMMRHEMDEWTIKAIQRLENFKTQDAHFFITSQGYRACDIKLRDRLHWRSRWNRFARRVNRMFDRDVEPNRIIPGNVLPVVVDRGFALQSFVRHLVEKPANNGDQQPRVKERPA